jgi:hypothetical protein
LIKCCTKRQPTRRLTYWWVASLTSLLLEEVTCLLSDERRPNPSLELIVGPSFKPLERRREQGWQRGDFVCKTLRTAGLQKWENVEARVTRFVTESASGNQDGSGFV